MMFAQQLAEIEARVAQNRYRRGDVRALLEEVRRLSQPREPGHLRQERLLAYLSEHERITTGEYQQLVGIVPDTAIRDIRDLLAQDRIEVRGLGRGTYYVLAGAQ